MLVGATKMREISGMAGATVECHLANLLQMPICIPGGGATRKRVFGLVAVSLSYAGCVQGVCTRYTSRYEAATSTRHGDPLSPLLFILAAKFLQTYLNNAMQLGRLQPPNVRLLCPDYPVLQYADDTLIVIKACHNQLAHLKDLMDILLPLLGLESIIRNPPWSLSMCLMLWYMKCL